MAAIKIIRDIHKNKESGISLKLDYEKMYGRVSWSFLEDMLYSRGFGTKGISWILRLIGGSICVRINDEYSAYFKHDKGLR